jgi:DNA mismatch repair protein MutL
MQRQLHPQTISLAPEDFEMVIEMKDMIGKAGFEIREFGKNTILLESIPADCQEENINDLFNGFLEGLKTGTGDAKTRIQLKVARSLAKSMSGIPHLKLPPEEMEAIIGQLFACSVPDTTPDGKPTMMFISFEELNTKFK